MPNEVKKLQAPPQQWRAMVEANTVNVEERTVEVVFATETPVRMYSWEDGRVEEVLSFEDGHVRWERINAGAPVLDNHQRYGSIEDVQIGTVVRAWKDEKGQGRALLKFDDEGKSDRIWKKVVKGQYRNISVGYSVFAYRKTEREGKLPEYRAIDWEPNEISFVPVPADYNAGVRSEELQPLHEMSIIHSHKPNQMNIEQKRAERDRLKGLATRSADEDQQLRALEAEIAEHERKHGAPVPAPAPAPAPAPSRTEPAGDTGEAVRAALKAERQRVSDIKAAVRAARLEDSVADELIDNGSTIDQARAAIIEKWAGGQTANPKSANFSVGADETDKLRAVMTDALVLRSGQVAEKDFKPEQVSAAREFRSMSLLDIARECLERAGENVRGLSKMEIAGRAITSSTSDFPVLLEGTNRRILLANYQATADTWRQFCTTGTVGDFREYKRLRMGSFSVLDQLDENAEYKNKKIPDAEFEKISAKTKGNIINVSRQMIVNDDLNGFARLASMLGRAAARSIEVDVYALLASNPTMQDGVALFHATHGNLLASNPAPGAPSVAQFDAMRQLMAKQKDPSGNDFLDIRPAVGLFPMSLGGEARVINGSQYDPDASNKLQRPNKVAGLLSNIVDTARLSGTDYYFFANPSEEPVIEVAFLDGVQTPYLENQTTFNVDGMQWKVRLDYGVAAIGWRGVVKNPGA